MDFICRDKNLIIEIDGGQHMEATTYDMQRTAYLEGLGYQIFRVWNHEVFNNIEGVTRQILNLIEQK